MKSVEVLILKGASPSSVAVTFEMLAAANTIRRSASLDPAFDVAASGSGVAGLSGWIEGVAALPSSKRPDILIVPGLGLQNEAAVTSAFARKDAVAAIARVLEAHGNGARLASSCSGVFLLAEAGVLGARTVTTSWWLAPVFRQRYPDVKLNLDAMIVTDGMITTAGAAMAQMDLMLTLIHRHADVNTAERCARYFLIDKRTAQSRYMALSYLSANDEHVAKAERWIHGRLDQPIEVEDIAKAVGLGLRTFARRLERATGFTPVQFIQRLRLERAIQLLETTKLTLDEIAVRVGYSEPSTLRKLLRRDGITNTRALRDRSSRFISAE